MDNNGYETIKKALCERTIVDISFVIKPALKDGEEVRDFTISTEGASFQEGKVGEFVANLFPNVIFTCAYVSTGNFSQINFTDQGISEQPTT